MSTFVTQAMERRVRSIGERSDDPDVKWLVDIITGRVCEAENPEKPGMRCTYYASAHPDPVTHHHGTDKDGAPWRWSL